MDLGDCPQDFDFVFHAPFRPKQDFRMVFAGILLREMDILSPDFPGFCNVSRSFRKNREKIGTKARACAVSRKNHAENRFG